MSLDFADQNIAKSIEILHQLQQSNKYKKFHEWLNTVNF